MKPCHSCMVRVRAACQAILARGLKTPVDGFYIDKEIETSAVDIGNLAKLVKALRPTGTCLRLFQSTWSEPVFL